MNMAAFVFYMSLVITVRRMESSNYSGAHSPGYPADIDRRPDRKERS